MKSQKGFTLIEALVTIVIIAIIGYIVADLLVKSFQSNSKSQLIGVAKQNGQTAMNIMDEAIRNAELIVCPVGTTLSSNSIVIKRKDDSYVRFRFVSPAGGNGYIDRRDYIIRTETEPSFISGQCSDTSITSGSDIPITDNRTVSIAAGRFTRYQNAGEKQAVKIEFRVDNPVGTSGFQNQLSGPIEFSTSIQIR